MKKKPNVQKLAIFILVIIALIALYIAYSNQGSNFWLTVAGGIATGTLVAVAQYFVSLAEYKEIDKAYKELHEKEKEIIEFKKMGVKKVLPARDDPEVYGGIIEESKDKIWVMGNTASRLLEDFANTDGSTPYKDVLLSFLKKGGEVKILISEKRYLFKDKDKQRFNVAKIELNKLSDKYENFNFAYFKHIPTHSIFIFDNYCLLGPIFDNLDSKATPALAMDTNSEYAQKYLNYFNHQWAEAIS
jgi:hypothetical protein